MMHTDDSQCSIVDGLEVAGIPDFVQSYILSTFTVLTKVLSVSKRNCKHRDLRRSNREANMGKSNLIPLLLLKASERKRIDGSTRFQKLVFLAQNEPDLSLSEDYQFEYFSHKYGPFSKELAETLDEADEKDLIEVEEQPTPNGKKYIYQLTEEGEEELNEDLSDLISELEDLFGREFANEVIGEIESIENVFNNMPLSNLLEYVYNHYPEYTDKSELDIS